MESGQEGAGAGQAPGLFSTDRRIMALKRRLVREATFAISMFENALAALWKLDVNAARAVRLSDDNIDNEEVQIEQECYEVLALQHPYARDFRAVTFILKVNADVERVADHASSIAKVVIRIAEALGPGAAPPRWPTALIELGERVPAMCHELLRAVLDEDVEAARRLVASDKVIDQLEKRIFEEAMELVRRAENGDADLPVGMLIYRLGRELERIGDLMAAVGEELVYLATGAIIRHEKRQRRTQQS